MCTVQAGVVVNELEPIDLYSSPQLNAPSLIAHLLLIPVILD